MVKDTAPIKKGEVVAKMEYEQDGTVLGDVNIIALETVEQQKYHHAFVKILRRYLNVF